MIIWLMQAQLVSTRHPTGLFLVQGPLLQTAGVENVVTLWQRPCTHAVHSHPTDANMRGWFSRPVQLV